MNITGLIKGNSYDKKIIRREKTSNGFKNVLDKAAEVEDSDTGEQLLKFESDGLKVPKPESRQYEVIWYKDWLDKITGSKSHDDFMEIYLKELGDNAHGDFVKFEPDEEELEMMGSESQFQTHRDLEAEKTLDIYSEGDNQQLYFLIGLGTITMINLGGMYIITSGLESSVIKGVTQGFQQVQSTASTAQGATGNYILFAFIGSQLVKTAKSKLKGLKFWG